MGCACGGGADAATAAAADVVVVRACVRARASSPDCACARGHKHGKTIIVCHSATRACVIQAIYRSCVCAGTERERDRTPRNMWHTETLGSLWHVCCLSVCLANCKCPGVLRVFGGGTIKCVFMTIESHVAGHECGTGFSGDRPAASSCVHLFGARHRRRVWWRTGWLGNRS